VLIPSFFPFGALGILILGSGYTFHNMSAFFHPSDRTYQASTDFNSWLQETLVPGTTCPKDSLTSSLAQWKKAPGAALCHPREEHLLPLMVTAGAGGDDANVSLVYKETAGNGQHAISAFLFA
jgi:aromatic ring-opening dioxygenase catalytic subunit (LigB family)